MIGWLEDNTTFVRLSRVVNEMKERYATARLLLYEACSPLLKTQEFDELTFYTDNLDYAVYGIGVGKLKLAFEGAHTILDKVALFINDYLRLSIREQAVDFTRLWKASEKKPVRPEILARNNPHLLGLYDISRDLAATGYSNNLSQIRNLSSHRYLVPHIEAIDWHEAADGKAYHIGYQELMARTTELLQLVRSSIIYLTAFIDWEERRKRQGSKMILPMFVPQYKHYPFGPQESPV